MKLTVSLLAGMLLLSNAAKSQDTLYRFKKQLPVYACFFGAGLSYGTAEALVWHCPQPASKFWNPYASWRRHTLFDGYHVMRFAGIGCFATAAVLSVNDVKHMFTWRTAKKLAICSVAYWCGQQATWHLVK